MYRKLESRATTKLEVIGSREAHRSVDQLVCSRCPSAVDYFFIEKSLRPIFYNLPRPCSVGVCSVRVVSVHQFFHLFAIREGK